MGRISIPSNQDPAENGDRPVFLLEGGGRDTVAGLVPCSSHGES